jgi:hypothetical protein
MSIEAIVDDWRKSVAGRRHAAKCEATAGKTKYFLSKAWQRKRRQVINLRGGRCEVCKSKKRLQVQHLTYDRLGREEMDDLKVVCGWCVYLASKCKEA